MIDASYNLNIAPYTLKELISYQDGSIVSRELIKTSKTTITAFAFAQGQSLSEHTTPFTAFVQVLDGEAFISVDEREHLVKEGEILIMPANSPHALQAKKQFKMLLTMAR
ncbi:cupin domain-containing protein [Patescibacteria group bacterium]|nr:cupin domain-containing protein [Patescibacteria group bacterium]MBU1967004.1 cupin domain-containing protein [Patescibacteria group bacterium]MBU2543337.1 cupin domain-containing protein [Patescibacteria group bacterium]